MNRCLDAMEDRLLDLLQTGLDTGAGENGAAFGRLAEQCEAWGLHTGHGLMKRLSQLLEERAHLLHKQDDLLMETIFQAEHYIALCRERRQETEILESWQEGRQEQDREGEDPHEHSDI